MWASDVLITELDRKGVNGQLKICQLEPEPFSNSSNWVSLFNGVTRRKIIFIFDDIMQSSSASKQEFFWLDILSSRKTKKKSEKKVIKKDFSSVLLETCIWAKAGTFLEDGQA